MRSWWVLVAACVVFRTCAAEWFVMNQNSFNPGDKYGVVNTKFDDPVVLSQYGFNAKIGRYIETAIEYKTLPGGPWFPLNSSSYSWLQAMRTAFDYEISEAKQNNLKVYYHIDFIVLPKSIVNAFREEITDNKTSYIDIRRPKTQEILQTFFDEFFATFPQVDGLMIRVGELYQNDLPFHSGNLPFTITSGTEGQAQYINVINFLRDCICVRNKKTLFFRTWDTNPNTMHANEEYYLAVTNNVTTHPQLYFSIKHTAIDYWRRVRFNPCLGVGKHQQIVEVEISREYEGKGAFPNYIMNGVINGFEELLVKKGLRDIANNPLIKGSMTWARGGGWNGPDIKCNEFWPDINLRIYLAWVKNTSQLEQDIFVEDVMKSMKLSRTDALNFYKLSLMSATAVLTGRYCEAFDEQLKQMYMPTNNWMRDASLGGLSQLGPVFDYLHEKNLFAEALAEKDQSVQIWLQMEKLFSSIQIPDMKTRRQIRVSLMYGTNLFQIINAGWNALALGYVGDKTGKYDVTNIRKFIAQYDAFWASYSALGLSYPDMATLYDSPAAMSQSIDKYRHL